MRVGLLVGAVAFMVLGIGAALAPAHPTNVKTTLTMVLTPYDDPYEPQAQASVKGDTESPAQGYCSAGRKIELFRDGKKVGTSTGDKYGVWYMSVDPLLPGRYVAKTKQKKMPASMQHATGKAHPLICKAAQSKAVVITPETVAGVTS